MTEEMKLSCMQSVINRTLLERHDLLKEIVIPAPPEGHPVSSAMTGRMVCLLPGVPLMSGVPGSKFSCSLEDIQEKFEESIRVNVGGHLLCSWLLFSFLLVLLEESTLMLCFLIAFMI